MANRLGHFPPLQTERHSGARFPSSQAIHKEWARGYTQELRN